MQLLDCADGSTSKQNPAEIRFVLLSGPCHLGGLSDNVVYFNK